MTTRVLIYSLRILSLLPKRNEMRYTALPFTPLIHNCLASSMVYEQVADKTTHRQQLADKTR